MYWEPWILSCCKIGAINVSELPAVGQIFTIGASHVRRRPVTNNCPMAGPCALASSTVVSTMLLQFSRTWLGRSLTRAAQCRARTANGWHAWQMASFFGFARARPFYRSRLLEIVHAYKIQIKSKSLPRRFQSLPRRLQVFFPLAASRLIISNYGRCGAAYEGYLVRCVAFSRFFLLPIWLSCILT